MTDAEIVSKIIKYRGKFRSKDKIAQGLAQYGRFSYDRCVKIVNQIEEKHRKQIAWRQLPIVLMIGIPSFIIGLILLTMGVLGAQNFLAIMQWRRQFQYWILSTGVGLTFGSLWGIGSAIRKLF